MPVEIRVKSIFSSRVQKATLRRIAEKTLRAEHASGSVTIYITDNAEIRKLNRQFHATNAPTDVLSFPFRRGGVTPPRQGDIVISYEQARAHARAVGWRIRDELELLTVHGILHLLGYDDQTPRARARMWRRQAEILGRKIPK